MTIAYHYNLQVGEWNDSLTGEFLWSSVNVSEAVPDVTGTGVATRWIRDGQTVTVDGGAGTVQLGD